jgi:crossover junction endodeoxyribonuclease RuvC
VSPAAGSFPLVIGIDPGLRLCGWGVIEAGTQPRFLACGVVRPRQRDPIEQRLLLLNREVRRLIELYAAAELAVEDPFVGALSPASALAIGQARAAAVLAAGEAGIPVAFYAPAAVKAAVSGYGQSDKRQVQTMVRLLLGLEADPQPADAADALAVAICHAARRRVRSLLAEAGR